MLLSNQPLFSPVGQGPIKPEQEKKAQAQVEEPRPWFFIRRNSSQRTMLQEAWKHGSIKATLELARSENVTHDAKSQICTRCDNVAEYFLLALQYLNHIQESIFCTQELLDLVVVVSQLLVDHCPLYQDTSYQSPWFSAVAENLWALGKQLKDESTENDYQISTIVHAAQVASHVLIEDIGIHASKDMVAEEQEDYRRAIRITIHHCRAHIYQRRGKIDKALVHFRKCVAVRPPMKRELEHQRLMRHSALLAMQRLSVVDENIHTSKSRTSSVSSESSSTTVVCGNCGVEKRSMPVCARCRIQTYCGRQCLSAHKGTHDLECIPRTRQ